LGMTNTFFKLRENIYRRRHGTCSGTIPFIPRTGTMLTAI
jgi:hypothetical protein